MVSPEVYTFTWTRMSIDSDDPWFCAACSLPPLSDSYFRDIVQPTLCSSSDTPTELSHVSEQCSLKKTMVIIRLNVRSLLPKEIRHRLAVGTPPAMVGFTDSWLDETVSDDKYIFQVTEHRKDGNRKGGEIAVYATENLRVNRRKDLQHEDLEMVWVEV